MFARPQVPHTHGVGRADPARHHHHGEHGRSWTLDRDPASLFLQDISPIQGALSTPLATPSSTPSKKRKGCQSLPPNQLSKPANSAEEPRSPKHHAVAGRNPLVDTQNFAVVVQTPLLFKTSNTTLDSPNHSPNMSYPPPYTTQFPPSFIAARSSPASAAYATATSYRQCVQQYADKHHFVVYTNYHGAGPGHAQAWRAQILINQKVRSGQEVTVINHTSTYWYTNQADAKEAVSAEVLPALLARR